MKRLIVVMLFIVFVGTLQGCETAKGLKRDVVNAAALFNPTVDHTNSWIYKTDAWIQKHMW